MESKNKKRLQESKSWRIYASGKKKIIAVHRQCRSELNVNRRELNMQLENREAIFCASRKSVKLWNKSKREPYKIISLSSLQVMYRRTAKNFSAKCQETDSLMEVNSFTERHFFKIKSKEKSPYNSW